MVVVGMCRGHDKVIGSLKRKPAQTLNWIFALGANVLKAPQKLTRDELRNGQDFGP